MFTRQDVLKITNIGNDYLSYLDKTDMVKPLKNGRKYTYSWLQVIEIKTILKMRQFVSLKTLREAKKNLENLGITFKGWSDKNLVAYDKKVYFITTNNVDNFVTEITGQYLNQNVIYEVLPVDTIIKELLSNSNNIINFEEKLKEDGFNYPNIRSLKPQKIAS